MYVYAPKKIERKCIYVWVRFLLCAPISIKLQVCSLDILFSVYEFHLFAIAILWLYIQRTRCERKHMRQNSGLVFNYCKYLGTKQFAYGNALFNKSDLCTFKIHEQTEKCNVKNFGNVPLYGSRHAPLIQLTHTDPICFNNPTIHRSHFILCSRTWYVHMSNEHMYVNHMAVNIHPLGVRSVGVCSTRGAQRRAPRTILYVKIHRKKICPRAPSVHAMALPI